MNREESLPGRDVGEGAASPSREKLGRARWPKRSLQALDRPRRFVVNTRAARGGAGPRDTLEGLASGDWKNRPLDTKSRDRRFSPRRATRHQRGSGHDEETARAESEKKPGGRFPAAPSEARQAGGADVTTHGW